MAWDASRPVPWERLVREWLIYAAAMAVIFLVFFRDRPLIGIFAGLLASGPLYLAFGYVLAKFGYQRKTFKELRADRPAVERERAAEPPGPRPKPPPTKRTGGGQQQRGRPRRR